MMWDVNVLAWAANFTDVQGSSHATKGVRERRGGEAGGRIEFIERRKGR